MSFRCMLGFHDFMDFSKGTEKCKRCRQERNHVWEALPSDSPGQHRCKTCRRMDAVLNVWPTCSCPVCTIMRNHDVGTLTSIISSKNGHSYWKHKKGAFYEFDEDPNEVALALAVLTASLQREVQKVDGHTLAKVTSLMNVTIHVQGPCDEPCKPKSIDCGTAIQLARQELARRC